MAPSRANFAPFTIQMEMKGIRGDEDEDDDDNDDAKEVNEYGDRNRLTSRSSQNFLTQSLSCFVTLTACQMKTPKSKARRSPRERRRSLENSPQSSFRSSKTSRERTSALIWKQLDYDSGFCFDTSGSLLPLPLRGATPQVVEDRLLLG